MSNIYVISQMLSTKFAGNFFVSLLGTWEVSFMKFMCNNRPFAASDHVAG